MNLAHRGGGRGGRGRGGPPRGRGGEYKVILVRSFKDSIDRYLKDQIILVVPSRTILSTNNCASHI